METSSTLARGIFPNRTWFSVGEPFGCCLRSLSQQANASAPFPRHPLHASSYTRLCMDTSLGEPGLTRSLCAAFRRQQPRATLLHFVVHFTSAASVTWFPRAVVTCSRHACGQHTHSDVDCRIRDLAGKWTWRRLRARPSRTTDRPTEAAPERSPAEMTKCSSSHPE